MSLFHFLTGINLTKDNSKTTGKEQIEHQNKLLPDYKNKKIILLQMQKLMELILFDNAKN
ncbi:MAG: hypothetical protein CXB60_01635 [Spiroplasma poulsonii]|nr:hypothetical protein [Spiroplasma poulsonii]